MHSESLSAFALRRPATFICLAIFVYVVLAQLLDLASPDRRIFLDIPPRIMVSAYVILLITALGWWGRIGFSRRISPKVFVFSLPIFLLSLFSFLTVDFNPYDGNHIAKYATWALLTGFAEEALFRGVVLQSFLPRGDFAAVFISSAIFGILHFSNYSSWTGIKPTIAQVIFAFLFGIAAAGITLFTGSIVLVVLAHGLYDFITVVAARSLIHLTEVQTLLLISLLPAPLALYSLWLVRKGRNSSALAL